MEFNLQSSDFLITNSINKYSDNLYTMLGYPVQTGDSGEEEGEEALPKGATKTKLKRNRMEQANDDDMDDDGKYIFGYEIV
jgi:hypothetical protein